MPGNKGDDGAKLAPLSETADHTGDLWETPDGTLLQSWQARQAGPELSGLNVCSFTKRQRGTGNLRHWRPRGTSFPDTAKAGPT